MYGLTSSTGVPSMASSPRHAQLPSHRRRGARTRSPRCGWGGPWPAGPGSRPRASRRGPGDGAPRGDLVLGDPVEDEHHLDVGELREPRRGVGPEELAVELDRGLDRPPVVVDGLADGRPPRRRSAACRCPRGRCVTGRSTVRAYEGGPGHATRPRTPVEVGRRGTPRRGRRSWGRAPSSRAPSPAPWPGARARA